MKSWLAILIVSICLVSCGDGVAFCYGTRVSPTASQDQSSEPAVGVYHALKKFELSGASMRVQNLTLRRDRLEMRFNGTFYFETPVRGQVRGAVFIGQGDFRALPPNEIERKRLRLILRRDSVESDFKTAVLRFTDDTFQIIGEGASIQARPAPEALELAADFERRSLKASGVNVSSRLACSILNKESPGFFIVQFDKGKRDRFTALVDHQGRIPTVTFHINAGEKGLIFGRRFGVDEEWMAFHSQQDYDRGKVQYSDKFDLVSTRHYELNVDVRDPEKSMKLKARMDLESRVDDLHAIPLRLNESLSERWSDRLKKALRVSSARLSDGTPVMAVQEDWEEGLTLYLPSPLAAGDNFSVVLELEGDYMSDFNTGSATHGYYPLSNSQWYPRHGYLERSTFDMTYLHDKRDQVISGGILVRHERVPGSDSDMVTQWKIDNQVALTTFAVGRFERHTEPWAGEGKEVTVEFYSLENTRLKEDFVAAEMMNALTFFQTLFGEYPYSRLGGTYHPRPFGQGFASMLVMPKADTASKHVFSFIAHETAHQWWGNIVAWRSYRDQWLSEGFAEYSAIFYTGLRDGHKAKRDLIRRARRSLKSLEGSGRMNDVGPLTLGHRCEHPQNVWRLHNVGLQQGSTRAAHATFLVHGPFDGQRPTLFRHDGRLRGPVSKRLGEHGGFHRGRE